MTNPLDSGFQAGPQSPFQAAPVAPLFVRDRYGSDDSVSTIHDINEKPLDENANPWAAEGEQIQETVVSEKTELPPTDRGWKAWSILAGAFVFEALIWGFPLSYGVFQSHYSTSPDSPFKDSPYLPLVGITSTGIFFLGAPLMTYLVETLPRHRRHMIWLGWPLCIFSLLAGSFVTSIPALIATQGIMYALGELILYLPLMSLINEWFITRRGLAYGIVTCSTGITGIGLPFLTSCLLSRLGHATTLRIFALILAVVTGPMLLLLKPRLPPSALPTTSTLSLSFLRTPLFYLYSITNILHSLALYLPTIFLPQFAAALSLSPTIGALLLAMLAVGQVLGQLTFGILSDRSSPSPSNSSSTSSPPTSHSSPTTPSSSPRKSLRIPLNLLLALTSLPSSLLALTAWGLAHSLWPLLIFALLFSFFANGQTVLWARMGTILSPSQPSGVLATFGIFSFQKGLGILLAGPVSSALVGVGMDVARDKLGGYAIEGRFAGVVLLCGLAMGLAGVGVGGWYVLPRRWRERGLSLFGEEGGEGEKGKGRGLRVNTADANRGINTRDVERGGRGDGANGNGNANANSWVWRSWWPSKRFMGGKKEREAEEAVPKSAVQRGEEMWSEKVRIEEEEAVRQWREAVRVKDEEEEEEEKRAAGGLSREGSEGLIVKEREWVGSMDSDAVEVPGGVVAGMEERWGE